MSYIVAHRVSIATMQPQPTQQILQHPASVDSYIRNGWSLVPIPYASKAPITPKWQDRSSALRSHNDLPAGWGVGLAHAYSGTMALDIDDYTISRYLLAEHGINLDSLFDDPEAVTIESGRVGHGKLLYNMPFGLVLPSKQIYGPMGAAYNLRCGSTTGATVQDVLPPSIHPDTRAPYRWGGKGHWSRLPVLPDVLIDLWQRMLESDRQTVIRGEGMPEASWDDVRLALMCLSPDCTRAQWIKIGMALHWAGMQSSQLEHALQLWDDWSSGSSKYPGPTAVAGQWKSFREDKATSVTMGTFWHLAREAGYRDAPVDVSTLFSVPKPSVKLDDLRPLPPAVNMDLFPRLLATRAKEVSEAVGCDPLVPLWAGLACVCAVADARSRLELVDGFQVPPVLWLMTVGDPADKKTPGSRPMLSVLNEIEREDRPRFRQRMLDWEVAEAMYGKSKRTHVDFSTSADGMLQSNTVPPSVTDLPMQPMPLKITVSDITSQKLVRHAASRPEGTLCYLDEMNGWVKKLTDKMSGEDRSAWVVSYESQPYDMDRVGGGSIHCDNLAVSIYGNIQPRVLKEGLASLTSDGLLQRFIPVLLNNEKTRLGNPVPDVVTSKYEWEVLIRAISEMGPKTYYLTDIAYTEYRKFQEWYEETKRYEKRAGSGDAFITAFGKLEGLVGRLMLVFQITENREQRLINENMVKRVVTLVKEYIIPAYRYMFCDERSDPVMASIRDYILYKSGESSVAIGDIRKSIKLTGLRPIDQDATIVNTMEWLELAGWVARIDNSGRDYVNRAKWAVNPLLATQFADEYQKAVEARRKVMESIERVKNRSRTD